MEIVFSKSVSVENLEETISKLPKNQGVVLDLSMVEEFHISLIGFLINAHMQKNFTFCLSPALISFFGKKGILNKFL